MTSSAEGRKEGAARLDNFDALRTVACWAVVILHAAAVFYHDATPRSFAWGTAEFLKCAATMAVPCFVMASGYFILGKLANDENFSAKEYYRRRVSKLAAPLIFWNVMCFAKGWGLARLAGREDLGFNWTNFWERGTLAGEYLWFLPMLLGLYLVAPLLASAVKNFSSGALAGIAFAWAALNAGNWALLGEIQECEPTKTFLVAWQYYIPYFLLGKALGDLAQKIPQKSRLAFASIYILATCAAFASKFDAINVGPLGYYSFVGTVQSTAFYMWILSSKKTNDADAWQTKGARWTAPLSFGVYLAHPFALTVVKEGARIVAGDAIFSPSASILVAATTILTASVIAFFLSAATTWAFKKIPGLRQTV